MSPAGFRVEERRAIRVLIVIAVVLRIAIAFRPEARIYTRPYSEDAFYVFSVSEHIAHGDGITVDGVHPTNGFQPLVAFLYVPFFVIAGADKLLALRLCFLVAAVFDGLSILFIAKLLRRMERASQEEERIVWLRPPIAAAALWALLFPIMVHTLVGLEAAVYSFFLIASTYAYVKLRSEGQRPPMRSIVALGVLLGLTVLARIDAVFFVIAMCVVELVRARWRSIRVAAVLGVTALAVSLPWWLYNVVVFGSLMPQSGTSESLDQLLGENLRRGAIVIGDILSVFIFLPNFDLPAWCHFAWMLIWIATVVWLALRLKAVAFLVRSIDLGALAPLALLSAVLIVYYVFFFSAPQFLPRYFHPFRILWLTLFTASLPLFTKAVCMLQVRSMTLARAFVWLGALGAFGFGASRYAYFFIVPYSSGFYQFGKWAAEHPRSLIGMEQSGTAGFMSPNVVNLDGKVDFGALQAKKRGDIGSYVVERNLDYIADWRDIAEPIVASAATHGARYKAVDSLGRIVIFEREH